MNLKLSDMKDSILSNLGDPHQLEQLYRRDRNGFSRAFTDLYPGIGHHPIASFWNARLTQRELRAEVSFRQIGWLLMSCLLAGLIAKLPALLHLSEEEFYPRNIGFIVLPIMSAWFALRNKISAARIIGMAVLTLVAAVFINALPGIEESDTTLLACIHLIVVLWFLLGFAHIGGEWKNPDSRLSFLKFNGDLAVISAVILIAGGLLTALTLGLFQAIGMHIEQFYFENIVLFALPAAPLVGAYLTENNPQLVGRISTIIARIFTPLVLAMLVVYLVAVAVSSRNPFNDRDFLIVFNALLIAVMALIFFSVAGNKQERLERWQIVVLLSLSLVTILVNAIALTAIIMRITEWGFTPNRVAVLGLNALMLINLVLIAVKLAQVTGRKADQAEIGWTITAYLPVYLVWALVLTFGFPIASGFN